MFLLHLIWGLLDWGAQLAQLCSAAHLSVQCLSVQVTHRGIWALAEACPNLKHVNIGERASALLASDTVYTAVE